MNRDSKLIFEAYKNKNLLNEAPVGFEEPFANLSPEEQQKSITGTKAEFTEQSKGKYDIDETQTASVIGKVVNYLKENGNHSPKLYKDFQNDVVAPFVREVNPSINKTNSQYTARVVYNAMRKNKIVKDETTGYEGVAKDKGYPTEKGQEQLASKILKTPDEFVGEDETDSTDAETSTTPQDSVSSRITNWIIEEIDSVAGAAEGDIISNIQRKILSSGGLGLEEKSITSKIKSILSILLNSRVLERKGGRIIFGSNFDKYEDAVGDTSDIGKDYLSIAQELGHMGSSEHQRYQKGSDYWSVQD